MPEAVRSRFVIDVSRLIWRLWTGRRPTGIDRVCLAYVAHFAPQSLAMVQHGNVRAVLNRADSAALFALLLGAAPQGFRARLLAILGRVMIGVRRGDPAELIYLNLGHTGLDNPGLGPWLRRSELKPVVLLHDLIPITHPHLCRPGEAERHGRRMRAVLGWADGVIANSAATQSDFADFARDAGRPLPPVLVAPLGVEPGGVAKQVALPDRRWFVVIGTIEARKNHAFLLDVWRDLAARFGAATPLLVIIGQRGWEAEEAIARLDRIDPERDHVLELGGCSDAVLAAWLNGATALLMPSVVEGFGLPVAEALAAGTPVIASDLPVYREYAGDIPLYLPASDAARWTDAIIDFLSGEGDALRQRALIADYRPPDWPQHLALVEPWLAALEDGDQSKPSARNASPSPASSAAPRGSASSSTTMRVE
ncbi:MAG: glycosyltransferase family 4 protein [Proteobacteria bacterium]|nr:glycosyltransferase family 4 protein [Pseudomonadota bacterium]